MGLLTAWIKMKSRNFQLKIWSSWKKKQCRKIPRRVAKDVTDRIQDEPGPAGDFIKSFVTARKDKQFFLNAEYLIDFTSATEAKQKDMPGHSQLMIWYSEYQGQNLTKPFSQS